MASPLSDRTVLVIGGSSGIGRGAARAAADWGARAAVVGRRLAETNATAAAVEGHAVIADLRNPADCQRIAEEATNALGAIDLMVCCAAVSPVMLMTDSDADLWKSTMDTNVIGPMQVARHIMSGMQPSGIMAFMSSESVGFPYHGMVPYSSSKAALEEAVRGLRVEFPHVRVACIPVGATQGTDITRDLDPEVVARLYPVWIETGRLAAASMDAQEVGEVVLRAFAACLPYPGLAIEHLVLRAALGTDPTPVDDVLTQIEHTSGRGV